MVFETHLVQTIFFSIKFRQEVLARYLISGDYMIAVN